MKKSILVVMAAVLTGIILVPVVQARPTKRIDERTQMCRLIGEGRLDWESEPWGLGGRKFQEICKGCHYKGNDKGAPFLHDESYTAEGWNSVFARRRVKCARDGSWNALSEEEILLVNDYLYRNGAWTYDPNTADSC